MKDQERKNKILTWVSIGVLILAILPIVLFAVFSVVTAKNPPIRTSSSAIEEPTLSRSEIRRLEREKKAAEEAAAKQTVTQNQPVITTQTIPQPPNGMMGPGMGMGFGQFDPNTMPQFDPNQFGGMNGFGMGMGMGFGDPSQMPQFDPSQFQGMGPGGMGFGQGFGQGFDPANMPQFDPNQMGGFGMGFGQGFPGGGFQGGFNGGFQGGMNNGGAGPNIIMADPVQTLPAPVQ